LFLLTKAQAFKTTRLVHVAIIAYRIVFLDNPHSVILAK